MEILNDEIIKRHLQVTDLVGLDSGVQVTAMDNKCYDIKIIEGFVCGHRPFFLQIIHTVVRKNVLHLSKNRELWRDYWIKCNYPPTNCVLATTTTTTT